MSKTVLISGASSGFGALTARARRHSRSGMRGRQASLGTGLVNARP